MPCREALRIPRPVVELRDGQLECVDAPTPKTYGNKSVEIDWNEVVRLLTVDLDRGKAHTTRSFAFDYGGTRLKLGISRDNLKAALNHEVSRTNGPVQLVANPLEEGPLGIKKRPELLVPTGSTVSVDMDQKPPRYGVAEEGEK